MKFRTLRADEIDCRIQSVSKNKNGVGAVVLLYKDARVDMNMLDEVVGPTRWKRTHELIGNNLYCTVSIMHDTNEWISKQDVGTESNTEKEKGQASDSFKRACFNWGIGRELYSAPFIYINLNNGEYSEFNGKYKSYAKFNVSDIGYDDKKNINRLTIVDNKGNVRYTFGTPKAAQKDVLKEDMLKDIMSIANAKGISVKDIGEYIQQAFGVPNSKSLNQTQTEELLSWIKAQ